jgi:hypothetical protein
MPASGRARNWLLENIPVTGRTGFCSRDMTACSLPMEDAASEHVSRHGKQPVNNERRLQ